jgi:hypothetical protein
VRIISTLSDYGARRNRLGPFDVSFQSALDAMALKMPTEKTGAGGDWRGDFLPAIPVRTAAVSKGHKTGSRRKARVKLCTIVH